MSKRILILGGGQAQIELIKTAKTMGLYVIVVGIEGNYPGYEYADRVYYTDIFDKESVLEIARKENIDGISMVCSDFGLSTVGYVCDQLCLSGLSEKSAIDSSNKLKMKTMMEQAGVTTAKFRVVHNEDDVKKAIHELSFPLIVKAVDLQGSRGIYICETEEELLTKYQLSINESRENYCIVEEFINGEEFGAQAFVYKGEVLFVQPHGDMVINRGTTNIPVGHYMPLDNDNVTLNKKVESLVISSIEALHFDNCAVNVDLIIKEGIPYIIEMTGRAGANFLPEVTSYYLGINYYKMILLCAIGESPKSYFATHKKKYGCVLSRQLFSETSGEIENIELLPNSSIQITDMFVKKGDTVHRFTNSRDCIGKTLCVADSLSDAQLIMDKYINNDIKIKLK